MHHTVLILLERDMTYIFVLCIWLENRAGHMWKCPSKIFDMDRYTAMVKFPSYFHLEYLSILGCFSTLFMSTFVKDGKTFVVTRYNCASYWQNEFLLQSIGFEEIFTLLIS